MGLRFTWTADHLNTQNLLRVFKDILSISVQAKLLMIHLPPLPKSEAIGMPPHLENVCLWFLKETELGPQFMWPGISSDIGLVFGFINLNVFQTHILNLSRTENLRQICKLEGETGCCHMVQITMISIFDARRQRALLPGGSFSLLDLVLSFCRPSTTAGCDWGQQGVHGTKWGTVWCTDGLSLAAPGHCVFRDPCRVVARTWGWTFFFFFFVKLLSF